MVLYSQFCQLGSQGNFLGLINKLDLNECTQNGIHKCVGNTVLFFVCVVKYTQHKFYHFNHFQMYIHSSVDGHWGLFHHFASLQSAAMNKVARVSVSLFSILWVYTQQWNSMMSYWFFSFFFLRTILAQIWLIISDFPLFHNLQS